MRATPLPCAARPRTLKASQKVAGLQTHLPARYELRYQETVNLGSDTSVRFAIDMILRDRETGRDLCVLDAKYKDFSEPSSDDVQQVIAYAHVMETKEAVLVYPAPLPTRFEILPRDIRVRALTFSLAGDLEEAGAALVNALIARS